MEHARKASEGPVAGEWADVLEGARDARALDADAMAALPEAVLKAFRAYRTCEFSTFARDGTPVTWPTIAMFQADEGRFVIGTSIGLNRKALQVRREPRVALLFSDPTGSGQADPPTVLVQGIAECPEELLARGPLVRAYWREIYRHQRTSRVMGLVMRRLDWYHIRLFIFIRPTRISWWQTNVGAATPMVVAVSDVA